MSSTTGTGSAWKRFWERGGFWRAVLQAAVYLALYLGASQVITQIWAGQINADNLLSSPASVFYAVVLPILVGIVLLYFLRRRWGGPVGFSRGNRSAGVGGCGSCPSSYSSSTS